MTTLAAALEFKYGCLPGVTTADGVLVEWPEGGEFPPRPTMEEQAQAITDHEKHLNKEAIKKEAYRRTALIVPPEDQIFTVALAVDLVDRKDSLTPEEAQQRSDLRNKVGRVKGLRGVMAQLEARVDGGEVIDPTDNANWPE